MKKSFLICILLTFSLLINSQITSDYYLPRDVTYSPSIPTPKQFFGHEIGEWHLTHDKLYNYMLKLADISDRAFWEEYARSYEGRPLGHLIISSPDNIRNIEKLRQEHVALCDPLKSDQLDIRNMPVFIKLGYGIHGNESSAQNASALVAYFLVAGEGPEIDRLLQNAVILIDPALNPDGMQRHSTWVNSTKSLNNNPDPASWEFGETWPGGRTNHYWFDLNRDYIMLEHPETAGRVAAFHRWKPDINTDHHEMGANETFFFQPGVQTRNNPLTPPEIHRLTAEIGRYHEEFLDEIGSLYYTEEGYDDFYVGKGSSYPDIHGSVGILFEQAGVKGHLKETPGGLLSFPFAIRNQFTVSLSTLKAGVELKDKLLENQRNFYNDALSLADKYPVKAFLFTEPADNGRVNEFIRILLAHQIKVYNTARTIAKNGTEYKAGSSFVVPLKQTEYRFIRSLFETVKEFTDSLFYDTSTWTLPLAFNLNYTALNIQKDMDGLTGQELAAPPVAAGNLKSPEDPYAYLFTWNEYYSPKALYKLQDAGIKARVSTGEFLYSDETLKKNFSYGTIVVPATGQPFSGKELHALMEMTAKDCGITIYGVKTGLTPEGIDLGSSRIPVLKKPQVAIIAGDGNNSSDAGEIWHLLDARFSIPVTLINVSRFATTDLNRYNVIIIAGSPDIGQPAVDNLRSWNRSGGTLIAIESGNNWISRNKLAEIEFIPEGAGKRKYGVYVNRSADMQAQQIPGSIFETKLDLTHPLCYGYTRETLPVFKATELAAKADANAYNNPVKFTGNPLLSGYCTKGNIERIKGAPMVSVHGSRVISIYDDPNFRAYWYGTNKLFLNAIFFGQVIR